ncbi:peptidase M48 [Ktedonosporobacter rubrisoli]|uniref:Peptidase M48 n=1 Tax=Ktedonosporobacter rubrisoli TaxID=2509675 RepID=A0A4P6JR13_KTERU|nr:M48 family metallopeptidase [Ktedonosporobacter rubrisoli]QBD77754.1 peptidase M48 [Ktedonosporobacter rubrisoli]
MSTNQSKARRRFPGLDPVMLQHPYDRVALSTLQKVPGLDIVVRKFIELFPERVAYIQNVAQTVRVTSTQCPQLYTQLQEACAILDVREPELYVAQYPVPNAYTSGHDHPYIVVTTGLLDLMNEDEVMAVIAHELGHIKSGHVLYKTMARCISLLLTIVGDMTLGLGRLIGRTLEAALLEWDRKSEFTADRSALLVMQDPHVMLTLMMKLAGGTLFQRDQMNAQEFLKQADLYQDVDVNLLDRMYKLLLVTSVSHPLTIVRAREIMNWSEGQEYKNALQGHYPHTPTTARADSNGSTPGSNTAGSTTPQLIRCPHCGRDQMNQRFCSLCGGAID